MSHEIDIESEFQTPQWQIKNCSEVELWAVMAYINNKVAHSFMQLSSLSKSELVLFGKKKNSSLWLCVDNQALISVTVKNSYHQLLALVMHNEMHVDQKKIYLDCHNACHLIRFKDSNKRKTTVSI